MHEDVSVLPASSLFERGRRQPTSRMSSAPCLHKVRRRCCCRRFVRTQLDVLCSCFHTNSSAYRPSDSPPCDKSRKHRGFGMTALMTEYLAIPVWSLVRAVGIRPACDNADSRSERMTRYSGFPSPFLAQNSYTWDKCNVTDIYGDGNGTGYCKLHNTRTENYTNG